MAADPNQIPPGIPAKVNISAKEFNAKYSEKPEVYKFLAHDCGVYLPHYESVTIWHLKDLVSGARSRILGKDVQHMNVPQYEGLTIKDMLEFGGNFQDVLKCFPIVVKETKALPRQYIVNVIYT